MNLATAVMVLISANLLCLTTTATAAEQPNLPHAFDAGWKGQKTCEVQYEDEAYNPIGAFVLISPSS